MPIGNLRLNWCRHIEPISLSDNVHILERGSSSLVPVQIGFRTGLGTSIPGTLLLCLLLVARHAQTVRYLSAFTRSQAQLKNGVNGTQTNWNTTGLTDGLMPFTDKAISLTLTVVADVYGNARQPKPHLYTTTLWRPMTLE